MANQLSALELLRQQAAGRPAADDPAKRRAQAKPVLNKALLASMHYLAEFAKELNAIHPSTEGPYAFIFLKQGPQMVLSSAFADYRARKVDGDEVVDYVYLKYQARYAPAATMDVVGADIEHCRRMLAFAAVPFEFNPTRKDDFGQAVAGTYTLSAPVPCEIYLRGDYDEPGVLVELLNVGRLGKGNCRIAPEAFDKSVADEIAKYALATQNEFAKLLTR
jgi:hypothetical protein